MMVIYSSEHECLICEKKNEKKMLKEWFIDGGRNAEDYDICETPGVIQNTLEMKTYVYNVTTATNKHV